MLLGHGQLLLLSGMRPVIVIVDVHAHFLQVVSALGLSLTEVVAVDADHSKHVEVQIEEGLCQKWKVLLRLLLLWLI
jgi:hypothetical protein